MKAAWGIAAAAAAVAVCYSAIGAVFCAGTLQVARRVGPAPAGASNVSIAAPDHARLDAWWLRSPQANGNCVMVLHGIGDSRAGSAGFAPLFLSEGYSVLLPDSRGHGTSEGEFVTYGLLEKYDALAWAAWLRSAGCRKVYGLGESLGAAILIQAAAVQPAFAAIVAECSFADLKSIGEYRVRQMVHLPIGWLVVNAGMFYARLADGLDFTQVSPLRAIARTGTPILLIHGLNDTRTPPSNSVQLARANPRDPLWLVPNAEHTGAWAAAPAEFRIRVLSWFASH